MTREQFDKTKQLTLERRKEILKTYFQTCGYTMTGMTEIERDMLVKHLRQLGYHAPMFDLAFRLLLSEQRNIKT